jgi:hypothetical protein
VTSENNLQNFAGDVQVGQGKRPRWLTNLGYFLVFLGLIYFISTAGEGGLAGVNWIIWIILAFWLVYTPIAIRKKWFVIGL